MKLVKFKIENYKSINDSGWIEVDDIVCIVGKNESGKTSLLKALWKFNPYKENPYSLDREWPRGRRKDRSEKAIVSKCVFELTSDEQAELAVIHTSCEGITGVEISKNYKGNWTYSFLPVQPNRDHELTWVLNVIDENLQYEPRDATQQFLSTYQKHLTDFKEMVRAKGGSAWAVENFEQFRTDLSELRTAEEDDAAIAVILEKTAETERELSINPPMRAAIDTAHEWLPVFIYMDDYRIFAGRAQLDQVKQRIDSGKAQDADETIAMIMEQAGLDLAAEVLKGQEPDKEQRMLDMNDASKTLTDEIAHRWTQKRYEVLFQADGQHFVMFVKDENASVLVPLEERSKGFQWFFSFDMTFMCETQGQFRNAVILLDEPGLHLHASAQMDLMKRMYAYAANNQLLYTTHLPFMVDPKRLNSIFVCEETSEGTTVHQNWQTADKDARFTLQAALGMSWSQSLFVGNYNLVVEGVTDFWYLSAMSDLFAAAGEESLAPDLVISPAGGASKVAYVGTILRGQNLDVCVLLDSDTAGDSAYEQLVHQWILDDKLAIRLGKVIGSSDSTAIEDLFDSDYYLGFVHAAYKKELGNKKLQFQKGDKRPIVDRVESALAEKGVTSFNKGRVAKLIIRDLGNKTLSELEIGTIESFKLVFTSINNIYSSWKTKIE